MINYFHLFLLSFLASVLALVGGVIFLFNKKLSHVLETNSIPFGAGVMITVSVLGLLPEALEMVGFWSILIAGGSFFIAYFFEHRIFELHHHAEHKHEGDIKSSVPLVVFGDTIHNFIDGIAIGATYLINPGLGFITAISTFLHEVPHEIGDFGILLKSGWKRKDILVLNIISASTTILGAFSILFFPESETLLGILMSVSAGIFFYLGAVDFLPHITRGFENKLKAYIPLILGVVVMALTLFLIPHTH